MPVPWIERTEARARRWLVSGLGPAWVVAVSGGSDSVGLLRVLHGLVPALGLRLSVAHLDHGTRGAESREDAEFVRELAEALQLPFDIGHWRPERSSHFESDARRARYEWLTQVARERGATAVAVGHTRDDQAETVLHRILRGTGPRGLAGIPGRRRLADSLTLVRPILHATRHEVREQLAALGQPFREDATNADRTRTRARLRHDLLPKLAAEYNPKVAEALARLGALARASERGLSAAIRKMERGATLWVGPETIGLKRPMLLQIPSALRVVVLRRIWRRAGWPEAGMGADRWHRLARLAHSDQARVSVGGGVELTTDSSFLVLKRHTLTPVPREAVSLELPGAADWPGGRVVADLDSDAPRDETIDLDRLVLPLVIRPPVAGDRFEPLGLGGQSTPLNDFFRGRRVLRECRPLVPLVCDQAGIVWVVRHRIADRVRTTGATRRTLGLRWVETGDDLPPDRESSDL